MADFDRDDVAKFGWLERKSLVLGRWATRFMILRDTFLFVCKNEPTSLADGIARPDHVLWLHAGGEVRITAGSKSKDRFLFTLVVMEPTREEHLLSAHSEEERESWVAVLSDALRIVQNEEAEVASETVTNGITSETLSQPGSRSTSRPQSRTGSPTRSGHRRPPSARDGSPSPSASRQSNFPPPSPQLPSAESTSLDPVTPIGSSRSLVNSNVPSPFLRSHRKHVSIASVTSLGPSDSVAASPASPPGTGSVSLLPGSALSRRQVEELSSKAGELRLDNFTMRSRSNILSDAVEDDDRMGNVFGALPEMEEDGADNWEQNGGTETNDRSSAAASSSVAVSTPGIAAPVPEDGGVGTGASGIPCTPPSRPTHSRAGSTLNSPSTSRSSMRPLVAPSVSAVDDDTRLKLRQIEASGSDPELVSLLAEQQIVLDKLAKLKLHRKVLQNEIQVLTPRLTVQSKVNGQYQEEITLHRTLHSKRTAHRIQVCKWAESIRSRLQRSEPQAFLKQQRRQQAQQLRQQQQQQQQVQQTHHLKPNSRLNSPAPSNRNNGFSSLPTSPASPFSNHLQPLSGPNSPAPTGVSASPSSPGGTSSVLSHADLIRLSNAELDAVEHEVRSRIPAEPISADLLTVLQREESLYEDADAHRAVASLEQLEQWSAQARERASSTVVSPLPVGGLHVSSGSASADAHAVLMRTHTTALNDLQHLVASALLREVAVRRQVNLLQDSIYRLTTEKEESFRTRHADAAAQAASKGKKK